jgi:predicted ArsR family transcriptional regulator
MTTPFIKFYLYILFDFIKQILYINPMSTKTPDKTNTRREILTRLKQMGPQSAPTLATQLSLSSMAIRLHLYDLQYEGLISYEEHKQGRGRPAKFWYLCESAQKIFPDAHQALAVDLLGTIKSSLGQEALEQVIDTHAQKQCQNYRTRLSGVANLPDRINALTDIRTEEGYMAKASTDGKDWMISENHCPICSAAKTCTRLCANELWVFQQVLGDDVTITREEHILEGARRCRYRIHQH